MADVPYTDIGITEETRQMFHETFNHKIDMTQETREAMYPDTYSDKYNKVFKEFIDDIFRPNHISKPEQPDHSILLDELVIMYDAFMTMGGDANRFNASVLKAAINVIRAL